MLSPLFFLLPTEDKQCINSFSSPLCCIRTDWDLKAQKCEFWKNTQSHFSPFPRNFNRIMILSYHLGSWVVVLVLLQAVCGGCEPAVQYSDDPFQQSHWHAGHRNDFWILMTLYVSLVQSSDLTMLFSICDLPNSGILIWKTGTSCIFPPSCFVGISLGSLLLLGFFVGFGGDWSSLQCFAFIHTDLHLCISFSSISQDHSQSTNSFLCYHILFLFNQSTAI